jgi:hypothetical protein
LLEGHPVKYIMRKGKVLLYRFLISLHLLLKSFLFISILHFYYLV